MELMSDQQLDTRGMNCPLPILKTKKAMNGLQVGQLLEITSTDPGSVKDMASFCNQTGHEMMSHKEDSGDYIFFIRKQ